IPLYGDDNVQKKTTRSVLAYVLDQTMRMLHPFMPFITEEIWQKLPHKGESITVADWPKVRKDLHDEEASLQMERLVAIIRSVRNIRAEVDTTISKEVDIIIQAENKKVVTELEAERHYLVRFCNTYELVIGTKIDVPDEAMSAVVTGAEIYLPLEGLIDFEKE